MDRFEHRLDIIESDVREIKDQVMLIKAQVAHNTESQGSIRELQELVN
ncbi:hypothetical protein [Brevibacillus sedimenti]|nr:hypothetical protein [Anoxybacillus sediminis]UFJ61025.1 hypothetical protein IRT44_17545 [Anoxybacillus sediminis]